MKYFKNLFVNCSVMIIVSCHNCYANTNTAGLQAILDPDLRIEKQEVIISLEQVSSNYIISNIGNSDINQTFTSPIAITITAGNNVVAVQNKQLAISNKNQDITAILQNLGVPLEPMNAMHVIDASPNRENIRSKLIGMKLLEKDSETPLWTLRSYYFWQQSFPAHTTISMTQSYKPTVNNKEIKISGNESLINLPWHALKKIYNVARHWTWSEPITAKQLQSALEKNNPQLAAACPTVQDYEPILASNQGVTTANDPILTKQIIYQYPLNEISPTVIKNFTLKITIPHNMYPLVCWHGEVKAYGKNQLIYEANNYVPQQELVVLFVEKS